MPDAATHASPTIQWSKPGFMEHTAVPSCTHAGCVSHAVWLFDSKPQYPSVVSGTWYAHVA